MNYGEVANLLEEHAAIPRRRRSVIGSGQRAVWPADRVLLPLDARRVHHPVCPRAGVILTFAIALAGSTLSSNSAFLGSIIVGNGINYPLVLMAYYRSQPPVCHDPRRSSLPRGDSLPGISGAAATAAAAYLGLTFTDFKGFSQFGSTGGFAMLVIAALSYLTTRRSALPFSARRVAGRQHHQCSRRCGRGSRSLAGRASSPCCSS